MLSTEQSVVERPGDYWQVPTVAQEYEARRFDCLRGRFYRRREESTMQRALRHLPRGGSVLDTACGTGRITALLHRHQFRVTGCDISVAMMTVARRNLASAGYRIPFVASDGRALPYEDNAFDAATCIGLLMHLDAESRVGVLRELARVSDGPLLIQYGHRNAFTRVKERVTGEPPGRVRYPVSESEMQADLARVGLREFARFWILRGFSSSLLLLLSK